ncbi:MAG: hypothetical protein H5T33_02585 [Candidatus Methanosuratus sp.]|nr:hypothetical protein [Candidatus Methanosuratincola sp.]
MNCRVCGAPSREGMCKKHAKAERKLRDHFRVWAERTGLEWMDYLEAIIENDRTGRLVKEVATYLRSAEG